MSNLYTKLKMFHYQEKIDSLPESIDKIFPPVHIRIKPTNVCNHSCWYCAYRAKGLQLGKDMVAMDFIPRNKMFEIIEDIADMGVKAVTFSGGGEPLCYPYIAQALKELIKYKVKFASLTNGALLTGEIAELFAFHGTWIRISMNGWNNESYVKFRKVKDGEFSKIIRNIKLFKRLNGQCLLSINFVLDKNNYSHFAEFAKHMKDTGIDSIKISPCVISNTLQENDNYYETFFKRAQESIEEVCRDLSDEKFKIYNAYFKQQASFNKDYTWCPYLQILPVIAADLNVYSCQDKAYNLDCGLIGSIKGVRFKDFWFKDKNKFFQINPSQVCRHHCVSNEKNKFIHEYLNIDPGHLGFV